MKKEATLILALLTIFSCSTPQRQMTCPYIASTSSDSIHHVFKWKPISPLPQKEGPVGFKWATDSTMEITYTPLLKLPPVTFSKWKVPENAHLQPAPTLLNGRFKLDGTYENNTYKGSGIYFIVYVSKDAVLVQICESMTLRTAVYYYAKDAVNQFEKAGYDFPFETSIRF